MSKRKPLPLYTTKLLSNCTGLSLDEAGLYCLLTADAWHSGSSSVKIDNKRQARRFGISLKKYDRLLSQLVEFRGLIRIDGDEIFIPIIHHCIEQQRKDGYRPAIPKNITDAVRDRDGDICAYCETTEGPFQLDHIVPWSRGGDHTIENLTIACQPCNGAKGDKLLSEWGGRS